MQSRRSPRMQGYDYSRPGAYFVTTNTIAFESLFGSFTSSALVLSPYGLVIRDTWCELPARFPGLRLDEYVVMLDHFHGILWLPCSSGANEQLDLRQIVGAFKSISTRVINQMRRTPGSRIWHRSFHDHVIRNDRELEAIRVYVLENPTRALAKRCVKPTS